jgi:hypothetical protein
LRSSGLAPLWYRCSARSTRSRIREPDLQGRSKPFG